MEKLDLVKTLKSYFSAKPTPAVVDIAPAQYASIHGKGDPSGEDFAKRIEALYSTVYPLKFSLKQKGMDFAVPKLEGLWWFDEEKFPGMSVATSNVEVPRSEWEYRLLIMLPEFVSGQDLEDTKQSVLAKKSNPLVNEIELFLLAEGKCVQMLHVGPFSTEPESLLKLKEYMDNHQMARNGCHHEIYLSDFRKTDPNMLKTILREPVG